MFIKHYTPQSRGILASALWFLLSACSSQQLYQSTQGLRQNECDRLMNADKRQQCIDAANKSYDAYDKERKAVQPKP
jgi:hypothetical protein